MYTCVAWFCSVVQSPTEADSELFIEQVVAIGVPYSDKSAVSLGSGARKWWGGTVFEEWNLRG